MKTASVYGNITSDSCRRQRKLLWHILAHGNMSNQIPDSRATWRNVVGLLSVLKRSSVREVMCGEVRDELDERRGDHFEMSNVGSFSRVVRIRLNVPCGSWSPICALQLCSCDEYIHTALLPQFKHGQNNWI